MLYKNRAGSVMSLCCYEGGGLEFADRGNEVVFGDAVGKNIVSAEELFPSLV